MLFVVGGDVGGRGEGGCSLSVGMLAVVEKVVVVVEMRLVQNNDSKRKTLPQRSQPGYTNNGPLDIGGEI